MIKVLGDIEVTRDGGEAVRLTPDQARTFALIALSGPAGISGEQLAQQLPHRGTTGYGLSAEALQTRVSTLRNAKGLPIPRLSGKNEPYRLDLARVGSIDAVEFIQGVGGLSGRSDAATVDDLIALWRGNPWTDWADREVWPWKDVLAARDDLVGHVLGMTEDERRRLTQLERFVALFPNDVEVGRIPVAPRRPKPRLLVVEDQIMAELRALLASEFTLLAVTTLREWNDVCHLLVAQGVQGAMVDLHLAGVYDNLGTTTIAEYLRKNTEIPVVLMSVAPPARMHEQQAMRAKYRLLDVVHKGSDGRLNGQAIVEAARLLVGMGELARRSRLQLWVESDVYHMEDNRTFSRRTRAEHPADECRRKADSILIRLRRMPIAEAEREVMEFHRQWGPGSAAATY